MHLKTLTPKQSLNKAYLKEKISRTDIELFKEQFSALLQKINKDADEEHLKSLVGDFLKFTFYKDVAQINPIGKNDMVIHTGKLPSDPIGVILEVKSPTNTGETLTAAKPNTKAFHELVLYYLRERIDNNNNEIKYLVATNIFEWYIIDANEFDKKIFRNTAIKKLYDVKRTDGKDNPWFYTELKNVLAAQADLTFEATCFDIREYRKIIENHDRVDDKNLIALYKILSPAHLLKLPFANDSNTLQPKFYAELLHLIGLYEYKEGSKKLISRKKEGERNAGSLLENTIIQLDSHDKISRLDKPSQYGDTYAERLYNVALELVITWVNRILFLKLLEAQLINYHKDKAAYSFLNKDKIKDFDDLDKLFFRVLARRINERTDDINALFGKVPYLNSSLFEPTELEHQTLFINGLEDRIRVPLLPATVLKDHNGKALKGEMEGLDYLFAFLNAYDFSSEGGAEIQEDNKALINASVLGLIFEKINGYKDGSFFTPGFITMYMCRETLRRAVVQKFNETKGWNCTEYHQLHDKISDKPEANAIINSLKICDPAVGSGHFLVSALNEIIAIKSDLRVLTDRGGRSMHYYGVDMVNDELIITDENGDIFEYNPNNAESQRVQEMLFHEKQTIIESCLFGVDINPNSVKICRLRLWIELLKNAYYKTTGSIKELETLPNIDINIKTGNSLISRFALDADLKQALKKSKFSIDAYKVAVQTYREAANKEEKREMERLISTIKSDFRSEINRNDPKIAKLNKLNGELYNLLNQQQLFGESKADAKSRKQKQEKLEKDINSLSAEIEEIKNNKIFENAFEWRFEFPEVLNDEGDFVGFDVVIGNPPYGVKLNKLEDNFFRDHYKVSNYQIDTYTIFTEFGVNIGNNYSVLCFIIPSAWYASTYDVKFRQYFVKENILKSVTLCPKSTFVDAVVETCIIECFKGIKNDTITIYSLDRNVISQIVKSELSEINSFNINLNLRQFENDILKTIRTNTVKLDTLFDFTLGIKVYELGKGTPKQTISHVKEKAFHSNIKSLTSHMPLIGGSEVLKYELIWKGGYINYGEWIAAPRSSDWFSASPRIVIREVTSKGKIWATIIFDEMVFSNSIDGVRSKKGNLNDLKVLLAILNSKLASYFHLKSSANSQKNAFPKVLIQELKEFPFPKLNFEIEVFLISLVDQVLELKKSGLDSGMIEQKIDSIVYKIYNLSEKEIEIVEGTN